MPDEKELVSVEQIRRTVEKFLRGRLKDLQNISVDSVKLSSTGESLVYDVLGKVIMRGEQQKTKGSEAFRVQVEPRRGTLIGWSIQEGKKLSWGFREK